MQSIRKQAVDEKKEHRSEAEENIYKGSITTPFLLFPKKPFETACHVSPLPLQYPRRTLL
jgi:hypothetical protein